MHLSPFRKEGYEGRRGSGARLVLHALALLLLLVHAQGQAGGKAAQDRGDKKGRDRSYQVGEGGAAVPRPGRPAPQPRNPGTNLPMQEPEYPPIQQEGDYYLLNFSEDPAERLTLEEFVKLCQEATGLNFTYNEQTQTNLSAGRVVMFGPKRIPKEDFYGFFQIQMFINEFVCVEVGPPHISVILIQSLSAGQRGANNLKQKAVHVAPEDLESYANQPATLITTVLYLPNIDTRQLSTSLRAMLTDTNTQTLLPAGENSIILQGFGTYIASLARLLLIVDNESAEDEEVLPMFEVIPLEYATGRDVARILEELLGQLRRSAQQSRSRRGRRQGPADQQGISGTLEAGDITTTILVDGRTNSLLVMAMPEEMPYIKDLVARLDVEVVEPERNFHIYNLENIEAEEVADVLDEFLRDAQRAARNQQGGTGGRAQGGGQGGQQTANRRNEDVVVVPDANSNSLLIAASKTRYEEILELIRQLDQRQHQVLIETALIELTGSELTNLGVEWALADTMGDGGFGATSFGLSTITDSNGDGVPDLRIPNVANGITAGILSGDDVNLPFLIAAAQNTANANVLNIPSILVNNNGFATVVTQDEQPTTTVTATGVGGQTQESFNGYQEAGISLSISPSISAARYLRLDIALNVSNFTGSFASSTIPPPRTTREITTSVNVPDGDTMVIGGVTSDIQRDERDSVPWLGDLPLLGALFRRDNSSQNRTTLYFFVTPHILRDRDFADLAEISYRKKLRAAEIIGEERVRVVDPDFGIDSDVIDFESFQVPLYRSPQRGEVEGESVGLDALRREELLRQERDAMDSAGGESP
jgi:general secretion pathway protein D